MLTRLKNWWKNAVERKRQQAYKDGYFWVVKEFFSHSQSIRELEDQLCTHTDAFDIGAQKAVDELELIFCNRYEGYQGEKAYSPGMRGRIVAFKAKAFSYMMSDEWIHF